MTKKKPIEELKITPYVVKEEIEPILRYLWETRKSVKEVANLIQRDPRLVRKWLEKFDIRVPEQQIKRVEWWNHLSERRLGYLCGFIATDGCLSTPNRIRIGLHARDFRLLERLATCITKPPYPIAHPVREKGKVVTLDTIAPSLFGFLVDMGITPNKSLILNPELKDKSPEFLWGFLRGCIDGDGTIYSNKSAKGESTLGRSGITIVSASEVFLRTLQEIFGGNLTKTVHNRVTTMFLLTFPGRKALQLLEKLPLDYFTMERKTSKLKRLSSLKFGKGPPYIRMKGLVWDKQEKELF